MKKNLLITGFSGFVAGSVIVHAVKDWQVHALDRIDAPNDQGEIKVYSLDLRDAKHLKALFKQIQPDVVIHTAAIADIDFCENNQELAEEVNVGGTSNLARLCNENGTRMIFCSTDTVFDGKKGFYSEEDQPNPINFYAETKVRAEQIVRKLVENSVVTRLSLVVGLPVLGIGNSFLARTIEQIKAGKSVKFPENEIRTPIDVITLGRAQVELAGSDFRGTIHLSGSDRLTRYDMARKIAKKLGFSPEMIIATNSNSMPGRAPRPNDASLNNSKAQRLLKTQMHTLIEGLELTLNFKREQQ
ncbi:MAG: NAD(P)-dependent oxidoreductase [Calditrichaeota bacterium]|nr:NAD(P)-dependent oxidoreductase [Calditrichota bacterium]